MKISFVALNQTKNSKNERDFKKIVSGKFWDCCVQQNCSYSGAYCPSQFNFYASQVRRSLGQLFSEEHINFLGGSHAFQHMEWLSRTGKGCRWVCSWFSVGDGVGHQCSRRKCGGFYRNCSPLRRRIGEKNEMKVTSNTLISSEQNFLCVFVSTVQRVALKWKTLGEWN